MSFTRVGENGSLLSDHTYWRKFEYCKFEERCGLYLVSSILRCAVLYGLCRDVFIKSQLCTSHFQYNFFKI